MNEQLYVTLSHMYDHVCTCVCVCNMCVCGACVCNMCVCSVCVCMCVCVGSGFIVIPEVVGRRGKSLGMRLGVATMSIV